VDSHDPAAVETRGKSGALSCLVAAVAASGLPPKQLADTCRMTDSQFSKTLSGAPGGNLTKLLDGLPGDVRLDYLMRLAERDDPNGLEATAAADLAHACLRYLTATRRLLGRGQARMAKARASPRRPTTHESPTARLGDVGL
jgi:hypothetical protein